MAYLPKAAQCRKKKLQALMSDIGLNVILSYFLCINLGKLLNSTRIDFLLIEVLYVCTGADEGKIR